MTKGGTNDLHGSVYEYHRNTETASNDFFNNSSGVSRPKLIRNIFGGSAGGALKQNRVFFFANAEMRRDASEGSAVRAVPSQLMRQGTVQYLRADGSVAALTPRQIQTQVDPLGIGPSAVSLNAFNTYYPLPNDNTVGDGLNVQGHRFTYPVKDDRETFISKFDVNLDKTGLHRLFVRGQLQSDMSNQDPQFPGLDPNRSLLDNSKGVAIGYDAVLTPNLYSSTRYGFTRQGTESTGVQDRPVVEFRGLATPLGLTSRLTRILPVHVIRQDITWIKDRHNIKFGGVYRGVSNQRTDADGSWHQAITNNSWLAAGGAELLPGDISDDFSVAFRDAVVERVPIVVEGFRAAV